MKRSLTLLAVIAMSLTALVSCTKNGTEPEPEHYTESQKQVFEMMHGTFKYDIMGITTTVVFGQHYSKPQEALYVKDGTTREIHGEITISYWEGSSYKRYYHLSANAKTFTMYDDNHNISLAYVKDFQYVDADTFKWKETKDMVWDTYKRQ